MVQDREYQMVLRDDTIAEVSTKRKVLMQLPTGGGKTVVFALIVKRYLLNANGAVLILVHRQELMYQAARTIQDMLGIHCTLITSATKHYSHGRVYIGMVESTVSRLNMFADVGLVIIDECHIANFNKVHNIFLNQLIIGVTATPISSSKKEPMNKFYNSIIVGPQIRQLIAMNHLAQNITRCPKNVVDATKFAIDKLKGDYNERQMALEYKIPKHIINTIIYYKRHCKGTKTIVFNVNIEHSLEVTNCFQEFGFNCKHLDSNSSDEDRKAILQWFKETDDAILCNVMIATVGFDEPTVRNVIINFSTLSLVKFIQCCGRGSRYIGEELATKLGCETKSYFNIIDMGANYLRFGDWCDDRDWEYIYNNPARCNEGIAPVKTCPDCEGLVHAAIMVCPLQNMEGEICGHEWERKKTAEEQDLEEMVLVTKGINVDELISKHQHKYEYFTFFELGVDVVKSMYLKYPKAGLSVKDQYFKIYYNLCIDWYKKTLAGKNGNIEDITNSAWHQKRALNNFNNLVAKYSNYPLITA